MLKIVGVGEALHLNNLVHDLPNAVKLESAAKVVIAILSCFAMRTTHYISIPIKFDSTSWQSNVSVRKSMRHDLLKNGHIIGMTQAELESKLGPPDGSAFRTRFPATTPFYIFQTDDLSTDLIGFELKNGRVARVVYAEQK